MNIPSRKDCMDLLMHDFPPQNIIEHSLVVNRISVFIAKKLAENGFEINVPLVDAGSLLHDVKKWHNIKHDEKANHGEEGKKFLLKNYPEVAQIVKKHMLYEIYDPGLSSWEEKIVFYADKIVNNDKIVTLKERFIYLNSRYPPKDEELRKKIFELCKELEDEICKAIGMTYSEMIGSIG
ncbi:MAG: HDIG domain-containing metalloprotein [archaeon]